MTRYGEVITENDLSYLMDSISVYMDSDLREQIAFKYSPCTNEMFLLHYIFRDDTFKYILKEEFGIIII